MSLVITQRPSTAFQSNTCVHSAVGNPIIYKIQREDYQTNSLTNSAGNLRIVITGDLTSVISPGASLYFRSDNGVYDAYYTVSTITYSAPDTTITFSGGYTAAGTTGFINLTTRLNYKATIEVWNNTTGTIAGTLKISPDSRGVITVDVSKVLWTELEPVQIYNLFTYGTVETLNTTCQFYIKTQGVWIGGSISQVSDVANLFFAVYAARQIGSRYNGFLPEYVSYSTQGTQSPKLLVTFPPRIWRGLPFSISAIFGQDIVVTQNFDELQRNASGGLISSGGSSAFNTPGRAVRFYTLNTLYDQNAATIEIRTDRASVTGLMDYLSIPVYEPSCNSIMLHWTNSLGGDAWWNFEVNHEYSYEYGDGRKVRRYVLFAENLTLEEWEGLNELNSPRQVYQSPIIEMTSSTISTNKIVGQQVYFHDCRNTKIEISSTQASPSFLQFNATNPHGFNFDNRDIIFINSNVVLGYFYAEPFVGLPNSFLIDNIVTGSTITYTSDPNLTTLYVNRVNRPVGCVVIPTPQTTRTKQEKHTISITVEMPETQLV